MFLLIIVIVMAIALAAELLALAGMAVAVLGSLRRAMAMKKEVAERLRPSVQIGKELSQSLRPDYERVRQDGGEILKILSTRYRTIEAIGRDANTRVQRLRLRMDRDSKPRVRQLQRDKRAVSRVLEPIRTISSVTLGMRSAAWLLRRVA